LPFIFPGQDSGRAFGSLSFPGLDAAFPEEEKDTLAKRLRAEKSFFPSARHILPRPPGRIGGGEAHRQVFQEIV